MRITSVRIRDFKRIKDVQFSLEEVTLLIGGNNSGKSSVLQAMHFAVSCIRAAKLHGKRDSQPATTLGVNQFSYLPTNEIMRVRHASPMTQYGGPSIRFEYTDNAGQADHFTLFLYRGKNANVQLMYDKDVFFHAASNIRSPFSIFVPGLAGISLLEERRANSIVTSGLAQGDANLYLRNVLHRLCLDSTKLARFHDMLRPIFPGLAIRATFDENTNQFINAELTTGGYSTPLELSGTGSLQALQVAAYVTLYEPKLLLLDEPDAHLHPGNQKQLVDLIFEISEKTDTQVVMASHSRHVLDRVAGNPLGQIQWLRKGGLQAHDGADVSLLMDIGALDEFEELSKNRVRKLLFCEDTKLGKIEALLTASGIDTDDIHIVPFNGIDNLAASRTVVEFFLSLGPDRAAVIYRDGDCMTAEEKAWLKGRAATELPERARLYISEYTDIEHTFCDPAHVATIANITPRRAQRIVNECLEENQARLAIKTTNKRNDVKQKVLKNFDGAASTEDLIGNGVTFEFALGKMLLSKILRKLHDNGHPVARLDVPSPAIADPTLAPLFDH